MKLEELINKAEAMEKELRDTYRQIYKHAEYTAKDSLVFKDLTDEQRGSVTASISAFWGTKTKGITRAQFKTIDTFEFATDWLKNKASKYEHLDISIHDVTIQFLKLQKRKLQRLKVEEK